MSVTLQATKLEHDVVIDPTDEYLDGESLTTVSDIVASMGLLPFWIYDDEENTPQRELFDRHYGFGLYEMKGAEIDAETGVHTYPGDPPLHPLAKFVRTNGERIYVYPYGIVAIVSGTEDDLETFVTRMD